ncbi:MAG TPA: hypothetical protein ENK91_01965, partial [Bacteroidetes bacterium]|nr:hypothetical protein [Bacteroidota bacterium]
MNKTLLTMALMLFSIYGFGQMYKIKYADTLNIPYYASIYDVNAFVDQSGPTIGFDTGYLYIKNGKKWHYNQKITDPTMHGSHIPGINHGILFEDELFVVKSNYLYNRDILFIYDQSQTDFKFYLRDSILFDTASSIANFAVYDDWIFIRDYWGDFSDFPNVKNINSYYFFHRENNKWIKKTKISYESDIS